MLALNHSVVTLYINQSLRIPSKVHAVTKVSGPQRRAQEEMAQGCQCHGMAALCSDAAHTPEFLLEILPVTAAPDPGLPSDFQTSPVPTNKRLI